MSVSKKSLKNIVDSMINYLNTGLTIILILLAFPGFSPLLLIAFLFGCWIAYKENNKKNVNIDCSLMIEKIFQKITPKTWSKTCDSFLDIIETFSDEANRWERQNLKYVAYIVVAWDLLGFFYYFLKSLISNAITKLAEGIATRRVSS